MKNTIWFLLAVWQANLQSAMEYRAAFLTQAIGMILNNGMYFLIWVIFFDRFKEIRGWGIDEMVLLFGIVAAGFGLAAYFFGNVLSLSDIIAKGQLDYYLSLPQPVLVHALISRSISSGMGDFTYGVVTFLIFGKPTWDSSLRFGLGVLVAATVFISFLVIAHSLAFWLGNSQILSMQASNAMITFAIYPINLFDGSGKFILFTIIPAAFVGAVPAEFVQSFSWKTLGLLCLGTSILVGLAITVFYKGLRRYESGSAIQSQI